MRSRKDGHAPPAQYDIALPYSYGGTPADTIKNAKSALKADVKIKEIPNAKKQPKPEKVDDNAQPAAPKEKPKRERRPDGMERPPEIPRRNDN